MTRDADTGARSDGPLAERLLMPAIYEPLVTDCKTLVAEEIRKKGLALRTTFGLVEKIMPDIVDRTVRELLPGFVASLEPHYAKAGEAPETPFHDYLLEHEDTVAEAMLSVADARAERIASRPIYNAYKRIRGRAHRELVAAVPRIAVVLQRHLDAARRLESG